VRQCTACAVFLPPKDHGCWHGCHRGHWEPPGGLVANNKRSGHWHLKPGPSACEADVMPLHHVPSAKHGTQMHRLEAHCAVFCAVGFTSCAAGCLSGIGPRGPEPPSRQWKSFAQTRDLNRGPSDLQSDALQLSRHVCFQTPQDPHAHFQPQAGAAKQCPRAPTHHIATATGRLHTPSLHCTPQR
jgi:hypothetical protein